MMNGNCSPRSNPTNNADAASSDGGQRFYGKYRGIVLDNEDPLGLGRIRAEVAVVYGSKLNWALPCTPYAGPGVGFYAIPPVGANVWLEFEGGDPNYPIWVGCFWDEGQVPRSSEELPNPATKIFKTEFIKMVLNDLPEVGGFTLECSPEAVATPLKMVFNSTGIEINAAPAIIKLVTEEGITLEFPPGTISMTEAAITSEIPESTLTLNEEAILINSGDVTVTATADVAIEAATTKITSIVNIEGNTNIIGAVEIEGETNIGGALTVEGETNIVGALTAEGGIAILGAGTIDGELII
ncbi:hypothetical protein MTo_03234 [Microcystis aeruginosa NIES-1211]|jgi:phage gp45-like|uniref:phage baseplate assembly protein V n=1 Tax=Microcystis TaxID=1125 RepID=UPI000D8074D5|nr:phage baseplate assembly protein V [Microcystis aeruginosa]GBL15915.1 hypothetical protein MTo_03234 [Microcystis aeruginosa NIES-1211]